MDTMKPPLDRIYLSPPYQSGSELNYLKEVIYSNWLTTAGDDLEEFEDNLAEKYGYKHVLAVNSGTAALHLILTHIGIKQGDEVLVSDLTFVASVNPIRYLGAKPVFIDSEDKTWNLSPEYLAEYLKDKQKTGELPKALIAVHLYGMPAQISEIQRICRTYDIILIEDVAEALGSKYDDQFLGTFGDYAFLSFNGNKLITTSGGGAVITRDEKAFKHMEKLSMQAKEATPHYEHVEVGFNYRMSNVLAALGLAQLSDISFRVERKRKIHEVYEKALTPFGFVFLKEPEHAYSNRWLTCATVDNLDPGQLISKLDTDYNIECRYLWKPMHLQPVFKEFEFVGKGYSESLFANGICLPSGVGLKEEDQQFVIQSLLTAAGLDR